jgi:septal ring factor EnvC (AmiA/AmiB activator)
MDNLSKKLASNDKILETISNKTESFSSAIKNQHSFNKMLESQISQLASSILRLTQVIFRASWKN